MKEFTIFAATEKNLKQYLSTEEFESTFDIVYIQTAEEFLKKMETVIPSVVVLDEDFLFKYPNLIKESHEKALLLNSMNDKVSLKIPVI